MMRRARVLEKYGGTFRHHHAIRKVRSSFYYGISAILLVLPVVAHSLSNVGPDLPPAGRSFFDHFIYGHGGEIPYPFDKFLEALKRGVPGTIPAENLKVEGSFIPDGRSLAKGFSDFEFPRKVITLSRESHGLSPRPLSSLVDEASPAHMFVAYAERANTIEVISWNRSAGRYEFQIIENYGPGLTPRLRYAPRTLCMSCHQHGGPIFTPGTWFETDKDKRTFQKLIKKGANHYGLRSDSTSPAEISANLERADLAARLLTNQANDSATVLLDRDIWIRGCGGSAPGSVECRRALLVDYLSHHMNGLPTKEADGALEEQLRKHWPRQGIAEGNPMIPERFLHGPSPNMLPPEVLDPMSPRPPVIVFGFEEGQKPLDKYRLPHLLNFGQQRYLESVTSPKAIVDAVASGKMDFLLGPEPFDQGILFSGLLKGLGLPTAAPSWPEREKRMPPPERAGSEEITHLLLGKEDKPILRHFVKYCSECHVNTGNPKMDFMKAGSEEELIKKITSNPEIPARLDLSGKYHANPGKLMPPPSAPQPESQEREAMSNFLKLTRALQGEAGLGTSTAACTADVLGHELLEFSN